MKIELVPIDDLSFHKAIQELPGIPEDLFHALLEDIHERGMSAPLVVDEKNCVIDIDSADRLRAALKLNVHEVPVVRRPNDEALATIIASIARRRNYSKSAVAYVLFPFFEPALVESRARRSRNLKNNHDSAQNALSRNSAEAIALGAGISRRLFFQAAEVHKLFKKHPRAKESIEPQILSGDLSLGYAINGIAGLVATKGKARDDSDQLELFKRGINSLRVRFSRWNELAPKWQHFVANEFAETIAEAPEEVQQRVLAALKNRKATAK